VWTKKKKEITSAGLGHKIAFLLSKECNADNKNENAMRIVKNVNELGGPEPDIPDR
jgi:hypothetical protein